MVNPINVISILQFLKILCINPLHLAVMNYYQKESQIKPNSGNIMTNKLNILDDLGMAFQQCTNLLPDELQDNSHIQKTILVFLQFGGEKLARQYIETTKMHFREKAIKDTSETQTSSAHQAEEIHISEPDSLESDSLELLSE